MKPIVCPIIVGVPLLTNDTLVRKTKETEAFFVKKYLSLKLSEGML